MFPWINASGVSELDAKDWNSELDDWMQFHDPWNLKLFKNGNSYVKGNWVGDVQGKRVRGKCFQWFKGNMNKRYWKRHPRIQIDFKLMRETKIIGNKLLYWFQKPKIAIFGLWGVKGVNRFGGEDYMSKIRAQKKINEKYRPPHVGGVLYVIHNKSMMFGGALHYTILHKL